MKPSQGIGLRSIGGDLDPETRCGYNSLSVHLGTRVHTRELQGGLILTDEAAFVCRC